MSESTVEYSKEREDPQIFETTNEEDIRDSIFSRTLQTAFLRMSSNRKIELITDMFRNTRKLHSLADILNIFFSVNCKLISYSKISRDSNSTYEQYLNDHDRMMEARELEELVVENLEWYEKVDDLQQTNVLISLLLLSGGNILKKLYWRLIKLFNERKSGTHNNNEKYSSHTSFDFSADFVETPLEIKHYQPKNCEANEGDYNTSKRTHKKVVEARKQWQTTIAKVKKEIETDIQKLSGSQFKNMNDGEGQHSVGKITNKRSKDKNTAYSISSKFFSSKAHIDEVDWIQLLPVWTVKKIFSYFDEKSLNHFKNVNTYWSTIIKEVILEKKARENLDQIINKSNELFGAQLDAILVKRDQKVDEIKIVKKTTDFKKRLLAQRRKGANLKQLSHFDKTLLRTSCIVNESYTLFGKKHSAFLTQLRPFPIYHHTKDDSDPSIHSESSLRYIKRSLGAPQNHLDDDKESLSSHISLVPSIIVTTDNMKTW